MDRHSKKDIEVLRVIAGKYKGALLKAPKTHRTRPTQGIVKEAVFNICQGVIENAFFLDLFAGGGALGIEALSRGALQSVFVENGKEALFCLRKNLESLDLLERAKVFSLPAIKAIDRLKKSKTTFDLIYVDPPYKKDFSLPFLLPLLKSGGLLFFETNREKAAIKQTDFILKSQRRFGESFLSIYTR